MGGQRFNMKARNYFAVVTGSGSKSDTIGDIRRGERAFFDSSQLFLSGAFKSTQMGTDNLAKAVSGAFWELVTTSMHQELRDVEAALRKKEAEWKQRFPDKHWMNRDDLLAVGRHAVLESMSRVNHSITPTQLESTLISKLWDRICSYVVDTLYIGAAEGNDAHLFKVNVDNLLEAWVGHNLPTAATEVAQSALASDFEAAIDFTDPDDLYVAMKAMVREQTLDSLRWDARSMHRLQNVLELNLRDDVIHSREDWDRTVDFMVEKLSLERRAVDAEITASRGPGWVGRWLYWQSAKPEHTQFVAVSAELSSYFANQARVEKPGLNTEDIQALQHTVKRKWGLEVEADFIHDAYKLLHKQHFLQLAVASAGHCRYRYGADPATMSPVNGLGCSDVLLFWRIHKVLKSSGNILRLEAMDYKKRASETVRVVLDDMVEDDESKYKLIDGPRVMLAEEIEVIRMMQNKLELFVSAVDDEKR